MTAGDGVKRGAEGTKNVTDKVVDSVEHVINRSTSAVAHGIGAAADSVHRAAGQSKKDDK